MRQNILNAFSRVFVMDCHGDNNVGENVPLGYQNENLFDIRQGVAIFGFLRTGGPQKSILWGELWGTRDNKYQALSATTLQSSTHQISAPIRPNFFLKESASNQDSTVYTKSPSMIDIFGSGDTRADQGKRYGNGIKSNRDSLLIDFDHQTLRRRMLRLANRTITDEALRVELELEDGPYWNTRRERAKVDPEEANRMILPITYRPFDRRWIWYQVNLIQIGRGGASPKLMPHLIDGTNLALLTSRNSQNQDFTSVFCTRHLSEMKTAESTRASYCFPLYLQPDSADLNFGVSGRRTNICPQFVRRLHKCLGLFNEQHPPGSPSLTPEDIFYYAYAVLHSPDYRHRYSEFLKIDFPRLPLTENLELFRSLTKFGSELVSLHLLESPKLDKHLSTYTGLAEPKVEKISYSRDTVWLDKAQTNGFRGVSEPVWNFHIGGYQVCDKWLKDRKGRTLSKDDITHYHKIVVALSETIRLMAEIDKVIDAHGGWPGAFTVTKN